ncbi:MAG: hydrogenase expression/formation protein HypE [Reinekea sp.]
MTEKVELKHGNGGQHMQRLIDRLTRHWAQPTDTTVDAAVFLNHNDTQWLTTTDGFSVEPLIFPGGSIGSLAVNGTVNDLAVSGALPRFLTLNLFLEEGLEITLLETIMADFANSAQKANVQIIAGDTKVLPRGQVPGILMATTGLGIKASPLTLGTAQIQPGDAIVSSGTLGDHGAAVMLARQDFGLSGELLSCCAAVTELTQAALAFDGLRFMRDPTRGGLTTVLHDIARDTRLTPAVFETSLPIKNETRSLCDMLGYEPLTLASEGRVIAVVAKNQVDGLVNRWRTLAGGEQATIIGEMRAGSDEPILVTALGGEKFIAPLLDDPLPRIC